MINQIKRFFKELKRVRWPKPEEANKTFWKVILFVTIFSLILFGLAIGLTMLWNAWGVGING